MNRNVIRLTTCGIAKIDSTRVIIIDVNWLIQAETSRAVAAIECAQIVIVARFRFILTFAIVGIA
jgi:hypothetical protein